MVHDLQRASAFLFYVLGCATVTLMVLLARGISVHVITPVLHSIDLPLLLIGMLYGGTSLYASLTPGGQFSLSKAALIGLPLLLLFCLFAYMNFAFPFADGY